MGKQSRFTRRTKNVIKILRTDPPARICNAIYLIRKWGNCAYAFFYTLPTQSANFDTFIERRHVQRTNEKTPNYDRRFGEEKPTT